MSSYEFGKKEVCRFIREMFRKNSTCLDVGACDGKWVKLLGDHLTMDAVEIFWPNICQHNLRELYRNVYAGDIADYEYEFYDLIIFGDVLEHMPVEKARKVLAYASGRSTEIIIGVPFLYKQGEIYGNIYERHIQDDLTAEIFAERYPGYDLLIQPRNDYAYYHKSGQKKFRAPR